MALFAGDRGIMTGEELTYDYNFDPYSQKNVQECRCGEPGCRGVLGPKPQKGKKEIEEQKEKEGKTKGITRKVLEVVEEGAGRLNKRKKVETKAAVYERKSVSASPSRRKASATKAKVPKRTVRRTSSPIKATSGLERRPSKLKRVLVGAKAKAVGISRTSSRRVVSTSSASQALLEKAVGTNGLKRSTSLKEKVESLRRNMVRTVRGAAKGHSRSVRMVETAEGEDEEK
jgi:[histone H3]-lysine4 N-trimethyltransferase ASH1L